MCSDGQELLVACVVCHSYLPVRVVGELEFVEVRLRPNQQACFEKIRSRLADLEARISEAWGAPFPPNGVWRAVFSAEMDLECLVRSSRVER